MKHTIFGRWLTALLLVAAAAMPQKVEAQLRAVIDLEERYHLNYLQSTTQLEDSGTISFANTKYPRAYAHWAAVGRSDADFLKLTNMTAAHMDAVYLGQGGGQPIGGYLNSQNHVIYPSGRYAVNFPLEFSGGHYEGKGTGFVANGANAINTELYIDHDNWVGTATERHIFSSGTWGQGGNVGYVEATIIEGFMLNGQSRESSDECYNSCGIRMWKPGETTYTTDIYARNFRDYGIMMFAPTPHHIGTVSVFDNVRGGIGCVGCWGGSVQIDEVSGDDNGSMIQSISNLYGITTESGGIWNIDLVKLETCVASDGRTWRGQAVMDIKGQFAVNIGAISAASTNCDVDALFVLDSRINNGTPQSSRIKVGSMKQFNFSTIVHDLVNMRRVAVPADYVSHGFEYTFEGNLGFTSAPMRTMSPTLCNQRIDFLRTSGIPSHTTCTPYRYIINGPPVTGVTTYLDDCGGTPPPDPCVYTYSAWGPCVDGTQTRTVISSSPDDCVGTPVLEQACATPPGPTPGPDPGLIYTYTGFDNDNPNTSYGYKWKNVKRFVFTNFKATAMPNFERLAWMSTADAAGLRFAPQTGGSVSGRFRAPDGSYPVMTVNGVPTTYINYNTVYADFVITLAAPTDFDFFLSKPGTGSALQFEAGTINVYNY